LITFVLGCVCLSFEKIDFVLKKSKATFHLFTIVKIIFLQ
jgi:hypothetical protein